MVLVTPQAHLIAYQPPRPGLIPVKQLAFSRAVNTSIGLLS